MSIFECCGKPQKYGIADFFHKHKKFVWFQTSDYSQMRRQAEFYFKTVSVDKKAKHYKGQLKRSKLIEYFNDQAFSYLKIGVTRHIIDAFIKKATDLPKVIPIKKRLQYYVATGFMPEELDKIASRHWRYDDLIKHLQELNDHKPDMLSRKALDTLVSHDIFFPKHTISCSFFYWLSNDTDHWDYPVHIVNNHILNAELPDNGRNQLDMYKQFLELMTLESLNYKGVFRYLIRDIKNKMRISFQFFKETDAVKELKTKGYDTTLECLAYKVKYDKKRKPVSLKLAFTKQLFDAALMGDFVELMAEKTDEVVADILKKNKLENISDEILRGPKTEEAYNNIPEIPIKALKIREEIPKNREETPENGEEILGNGEETRKVRGAIKRFSIAEEMQKAYESFEQNNMELFKKAFNDLVEPFKSPNDEQKKALKVISDISKIINEDANNSAEQSAAEAQLLLEILLSIALFTWEYEDRELSFYPSAAVENEAQYSEGLGGIVVSEKLFSISDKSNTLGKNQVSLLIARNNALEEASNQIFYKIGISDHVNHRYRTFAQQSAVATIISRNGSHGIGSHAIPSLVNDHRDLWQKGDKEALLTALRDDDIFYKYLQDRFEFITQLGNPTLPKWTLTTWFGKDLLKRFLMQRHLLNNLASSERLRAFEFLQQSNWNHKEALETNVGAVRECLYGEVIKEGDKWFVKKIGSTNPTHKREIVWKEPKDAQTADKIRVSGQLSVKEGVPYLKDAELIAGRILLKVRLRQFLSYDADGQSIKINQQGEKVKLAGLTLKTNARGELFEKNAEGQWVKRTDKEDFQDKSELISHSIHVIRCTDIEELQKKIVDKKDEIEKKRVEIEKKREKLTGNRVG